MTTVIVILGLAVMALMLGCLNLRNQLEEQGTRLDELSQQFAMLAATQASMDGDDEMANGILKAAGLQPRFKPNGKPVYHQ